MIRKIKNNLLEKIKNLHWRIQGPKFKNPSIPERISSILFICKGNICRSPFAEHLAQRIASERQVTNLVFGSAGTEVGTRVPSPAMAKEVARNYGVNLDGHLSKSIKEIDLERYDMIITMEETQLKELSNLFPEKKDKIFLLPLLQPSNSNSFQGFLKYNIPDPYGKGREEFIACFDRIMLCIERLFMEIGKRTSEERAQC